MKREALTTKNDPTEGGGQEEHGVVDHVQGVHNQSYSLCYYQYASVPY